MGLQLFYWLLEDDDDFPFVVGRRTGNLTLNKKLDRETISNYTFTVITSNNCNNKPDSIDEVKPESRITVNVKVFTWIFEGIICSIF